MRSNDLFLIKSFWSTSSNWFDTIDTTTLTDWTVLSPLPCIPVTTLISWFSLRCRRQPACRSTSRATWTTSTVVCYRRIRAVFQRVIIVWCSRKIFKIIHQEPITFANSAVFTTLTVCYEKYWQCENKLHFNSFMESQIEIKKNHYASSKRITNHTYQCPDRTHKDA